MHTTKYYIFLRAVEFGSVKKAAEKLDYTESAVSQALHSLERELDVTLFIRKKSGLILTAEGRQLLPYIRTICDSENNLDQKIDSMKGILSGEIVIGAYHTVACRLLPKMIRNFTDMHPGISFSIKEGDYSELLECINDGSVDFCFLSIYDTKGLEITPYVTEPLYAVFPSGSEKSKLGSISVKSLENMPMISLLEKEEVDNQRMFREEKIKPQISYIVQEYETVLAMIENGLGIGVMPGIAYNSSFNVSFVPLSPVHERTLSIVTKENHRVSTAVNAFTDFLMEQRDLYINENREIYSLPGSQRERPLPRLR